jgi:hypothetical protein
MSDDARNIPGGYSISKSSPSSYGMTDGSRDISIESGAPNTPAENPGLSGLCGLCGAQM